MLPIQAWDEAATVDGDAGVTVYSCALRRSAVKKDAAKAELDQVLAEIMLLKFAN